MRRIRRTCKCRTCVADPSTAAAIDASRAECSRCRLSYLGVQQGDRKASRWEWSRAATVRGR
eukprot:scaffold30462_cov28-Tisochrysis_lutea.AAC.5